MNSIPTIAVVMIVRNELGRVGRALLSVRDFVDTWLVVDTGSSDGTIEEIEMATKGWAGNLFERPWANFGVNRTELLKLARENSASDWLLTIDADHVVEGGESLRTTVADAERRGFDALLVPFTEAPLVWTIRLMKTQLPWRYVGSTREYLTCDEPFKAEKADGPRIIDLADGFSRLNKWRRDVEELTEELSEYPDNARSWFYLGESYRGLEQYRLAAMAYTNCAVKTNAGEERYLALAMSGEMLVALGEVDEGVARLLQANSIRPERREALLVAVDLLNKLGRHGEVVRMLSGGPITRSVPRSDMTAIVPDAYGPAMAQQLAIARASKSRK